MRELKPIEPVPPIRRDMDLVANRLPSTNALAGQHLTLEYEDGSVLALAFADGRVRWQSANLSGDDAYDAVEIRPGIFYIDLTAADGSRAFTHIVDRNVGRALSLWYEILPLPGNEALRVLHKPAKLQGAGANDPIAETRELLGKRLFCQYSDEAALEHIYVNSVTIVWQWLICPPILKTEVGIEAATMWKIADQLYLLGTRGPDPIQLTLLMDLEQMRNVGRLFGTGSFGTGLFGTVERPVGAKITFLGEFDYPSGYQPG